MPWTDIVTTIAAAGGVGGGGGAVVVRYGRRVLTAIATDIAHQANEPLKADLEQVKLSLATQFGGNGGGMREAINKLQVDVAEVKGRLTATSIPTVEGKHEAG